MSIATARRKPPILLSHTFRTHKWDILSSSLFLVLSPNSANAIALDSYYKVELVPISDELETAMNKKAGEEFGARVQGMYNKLGTATSDASLVEQVWAALTDPYLVHAQYYKKETPEVIKKIADLIASDSAAVPPHDRLARICLTSRFLRSRLLALGLSTLEDRFGQLKEELDSLLSLKP